MPRWFDRAVDHYLSGQGYTKARRSGGNIGVVHAGETPFGTSEFITSTDDAKQIMNEKLAVTSSWAFSDIRVIGNEGSQAKMGVHEIKGEETTEVVDHEYERLMRQPNPHWSGMLLKLYTFWWWLLRGEAYWLKVFDRTGSLREIWPLPASRMRPIPDRRKYISGYRYTPGSNSEKGVTFLPQQIVFFRFPNPFDYHRGLSPLSAYIRALRTDTKAADWNLDTFDKEMTLKTLISLPADVAQPIYEKAKTELLEQLVQKQMRYIITRAGDLTMERFSLTPKEAEYLSSREMSREEIDRVFGFPEGYWSARANRSNADAAKAALIDSVIWPLLELMAADVTTQLIVPEYGKQYKVQFNDIRMVDRRLQLAEHNVEWKVSTFDEARDDLNLDPYKGPMAAIIGALPMPLATAPQFILAMQGAGGQSQQGGERQGGVAPAQLPPSQVQPTPEQQKAIKEDLRKWKGIALRRLRAGESPVYDFESDAIPAVMMATIKAVLVDASDEEAIKAAFEYSDNGGKEVAALAATFRGQQWEGYP